MINFEAIDAKIGRARRELRLLKADIDSFCKEKSRLIVPEGSGEQVSWVYRGDTPNPPIDWSIRVGEFAYNLRSSLDHLVWQLVKANGEKANTRNLFPIYKKIDEASEQRLSERLKGVSVGAQGYIRSIQPGCADLVGIGHRLANLNAIGNIDKHRHVIVTSVRWDGIDPRVIDRLSWPDRTGTGGKAFVHLEVPVWGPRPLVHGQMLFSTIRLADSQYFDIPVEAVFEDKDIEGERWGDGLSVAETLDDCAAGVEMVVGHFKLASESVSDQL